MTINKMTIMVTITMVAIRNWWRTPDRRILCNITVVDGWVLMIVAAGHCQWQWEGVKINKHVHVIIQSTSITKNTKTPTNKNKKSQITKSNGKKERKNTLHIIDQFKTIGYINLSFKRLLLAYTRCCCWCCWGWGLAGVGRDGAFLECHILSDTLATNNSRPNTCLDYIRVVDKLTRMSAINSGNMVVRACNIPSRV
jgi:uncharacterized membrane protein YsdA (DUF1294 family)